MAKVEKASRINALPPMVSSEAGGGSNCLQLRLALPICASCPVCRTDFEIVLGRLGRPLRFCSEACRRNEQRRQQIAWERRRALQRRGGAA